MKKHLIKNQDSLKNIRIQQGSLDELRKEILVGKKNDSLGSLPEPLKAPPLK